MKGIVLILIISVASLNFVINCCSPKEIDFNEAIIDYSPTSGPPGTVVSISGKFLIDQKTYDDLRYKDVNILWFLNPDYSNPEVIGSARIDAGFEFNTQVVIPEKSGSNSRIVVQPPPGRDSVIPFTGSVYPLPFNAIPFTKIHGRVFIPDSGGNPEFLLPYARIELKVARPSVGTSVIKEETFTSANGEFEFSVNAEKGDKLEVKLFFEDKFNGVNYFSIIDTSSYDRTAFLIRNLTVDESNLGKENNLDFVLAKNLSPQDYSSYANLDMVHYIGQYYRYSHQAVKYAIEVLGADISKLDGNPALPVKVMLNSWVPTGTSYNTHEAEIYICDKDTQNKGFMKSPTGVFHEWGHHFMFSQFNIEPFFPSKTVNHGGYLNPDTSDSLAEGEANFFSILMLRHYGYQKGDPMFDIIGIEANWPAWEMRDKLSQEEFAVTSLLWDIIDYTPNEKLEFSGYSQTGAKDTISFSLSDLWDIVRDSSTHNVFGLYQNLITNNPSSKTALDKLFIEHGFFNDTERGDGAYNSSIGFGGSIFGGEPFSNGPITNPDFRFIDLGSGHKLPYGQVYTEGEAVGYASNYQRPNRKSTCILEGSFIKIEDASVNSCQIIFEFEDGFEYFNFQFEQEVVDGLLYFTMPPSRYRTIATIVPNSEEEKSLVVTSKDYFSLLGSSDEYFLKHNFGLDPWFPLLTIFEHFYLIVGIVLLCLIVIVVALVRRRKS